MSATHMILPPMAITFNELAMAGSIVFVLVSFHIHHRPSIVGFTDLNSTISRLQYTTFTSIRCQSSQGQKPLLSHVYLSYQPLSPDKHGSTSRNYMRSMAQLFVSHQTKSRPHARGPGKTFTHQSQSFPKTRSVKHRQ